MACIRPLANGNFRADVRMKGIVKNENGDISAIERLIVDFGQDPEAITADDTGPA